MAVATVLVVVWNIYVFCLFGADKRRAAAKAWRVPERTLLICAFLMGGVGAFFGMRAFRHKTKHRRFTLLVPCAAVCTLAVAMLFVLVSGAYISL